MKKSLLHRASPREWKRTAAAFCKKSAASLAAAAVLFASVPAKPVFAADDAFEDSPSAAEEIAEQSMPPGRLQIFFPGLNQETLHSVSQNYTASQLLAAFQRTGGRICVDENWEKADTDTLAYYRCNSHTMHFRKENPSLDVFAHELLHASQDHRLRDRINAYSEGKVTDVLQNLCLSEAGAHAIQSIVLLQEYERTGISATSDATSYFSPGIEAVMNGLRSFLDKHPEYQKTLEKNDSLPPPELMDELMAAYLRDGGIASHGVRIISIYLKIAASGTPLNLSPATLSAKEIAEMATGTLYPEGMTFPKTEKAFNDLGLTLETALKKDATQKGYSVVAQEQPGAPSAQKSSAETPTQKYAPS